MMMINGIPVHLNPLNTKHIKKFSNALMKVTSKTSELNKKLSSKEVTEKNFRKKQRKIIKNFFIDIAGEDKALLILEDCETLDDYINAFTHCAEEINKETRRLKG